MIAIPTTHLWLQARQTPPYPNQLLLYSSPSLPDPKWSEIHSFVRYVAAYCRCARNIPLVLLLALLLLGCAEPPPQNINNACDMLQEKKSWYRAAAHSQQRWGIPMEVTLAFIHQESSFRGGARPPRKELLGFIPWFRASSAQGYAQAVDQSWKEYKKENNRWFARRNSFKDSVDFIGWYNHKSVQQLNLASNDAYSLYLAYHEGRGGFSRKSYQQKEWLIKVAEKVKRRSANYRKQLKSCALEEPGSWLSRLLGS